MRGTERRFGFRALATVFAMAGLMVALAGCGSSDNPTAAICMSFDGEAGAGGSEVRMQDAAGSSCQVAEIEILVSDVNGVFGAAFDLAYQSQRVRFSGIDTSDSVLARDGAQLLVEATDTGSLIVVGIARTGTAAAIDISGTEVLARVVFERTSPNASTSELNFLNENLLDASGPPLPIPGVAWRDGTFTFVEE